MITGGAGFIGSNFIIDWFNHSDEKIINLDKLTYSGNLENLKEVTSKKNYKFIQGDICDSDLIEKILATYHCRAIINFAAESHVDRSINGPGQFIQTNIVGTYRLLNSAYEYWRSQKKKKSGFRFLHISTDEVYGSLKVNEDPFLETNQYAPNSPYAATKASSDHLVRAWHKTYGLPVITTNCSNNYGPFQFPEKLIPLIIVNALNNKTIPIYGDGLQIRDWLYVKDHTSAIRTVLERGSIGETYNIGGDCEKTNLSIAKTICLILDDAVPNKNKDSFENLINFVEDRPGHDRRYAIDTHKIKNELHWSPRETLESGLKATIAWYLNNIDWVSNVTSGEYQDWIKTQYGIIN